MSSEDILAAVQAAAAPRAPHARGPVAGLLRWFETRVDPYPDRPARPTPTGFWAFLWQGTEGMRPWLAVMAVFTAAVGLFEGLLYAWLGKLVDWLAATPASRLWEVRGGELKVLAAVLLGSIVVVAAQTLIKHQTLAANFPMRLRWIYHRLMLSQSMAFFQDEFAGRVSAKVMQTALAARDTVFTVTDILVYVSIYVVTMLAIAAGLDGWLLLPFVVWLLLYALAMLWFVPRLARTARQQADARSLMTGRITDAYTNIATVKLFSHSQREAAYARAAMNDFMGPVRMQMRLVTGFETVNHTMVMLLTLASAGMGLWQWSAGHVGVGAVATVVAMAMRLGGMSHWIMWEVAGLFENVGTVQDGMSMLGRGVAVQDRPGAVPLAVTRGEIVFDHVDFHYGGKGTVFDNLNLRIAAGEKIGLVGRSGAGKSTLVNLLLRFHDLEGGRILIDGQDIAGVTQDSLRTGIGMVTQDTSLLHRSVRDNIAYGRPDASEAAIETALARAQVGEFIHGLVDPKDRRGLDAHVGERGVKLSGGQRQRVAIARVMLKDAPILLLDEATSALDSEVEAAIQSSLAELMRGKTVVAIAHRLSTIAAMDRLIVLERGRIVEEGTHAQLLAHGGAYARLWARQSGGFLGEGD